MNIKYFVAFLILCLSKFCYSQMAENSSLDLNKINSWNCYLQVNFNDEDFFLGAGLGFPIKKNLPVTGIFSVHYRPSAKSVLVKENSNEYYLFREHRLIFLIGAEFKMPINAHLVPFAAISTGTSFVFYRGSNRDTNEEIDYCLDAGLQLFVFKSGKGWIRAGFRRIDLPADKNFIFLSIGLNL